MDRLFFWREWKMDKILVWKLVGPNFDYGHQSIRFHLVVIAVRLDLVWKRSGRNSGSSVLAKNSGVGYFYVSQLTSCVREQKKKSLNISPRTKTILCLSVLFMLISADGPFYACQSILCLSGDELLQFMPISVKKMKSIYLETTVFSATVCPVRKIRVNPKTNGPF